MDREAMQMALEALETNNKAWKHLTDSGDAGFWEAEEQPFYELSVKAITTLRQALETEQEPVAWTTSLDFDDGDQEIIPAKDKGKLGTSNCDIPLYTAPPKQWVGLTDEEIVAATNAVHGFGAIKQKDMNFAKAIEAKLKEKNVGAWSYYYQRKS